MEFNSAFKWLIINYYIITIAFYMRYLHVHVQETYSRTVWYCTRVNRSTQ